MRATQKEVWGRLRELTDLALSEAGQTTVTLVLNRKESLSNDPDDRATEYLSDLEANELISGFRESGFRTRYFEGEEAFIGAVLDDREALGHPGRSIVYNIAQSGTDPGRKSLIPSFCALNGIPTCNSHSYAVSLARHKLHVHALLKRFGLPTPECWSYSSESGWLMGERPPEDEALIAKAGYESASIGLDQESVGVLSPDYEEILSKKSARLGQPFVVQRFIAGREFETPTVQIDGKFFAIGPVGITLNGSEQLGKEILAYDAVAFDGFGFQPDVDDEELANWVRSSAESTCEVLGLSGFARVDFRVGDDGDGRIIDVSTSPHIVRHSSYWAAFESAGWSHSEMLACMIALNGNRLGWFSI